MSKKNLITYYIKGSSSHMLDAFGKKEPKEKEFLTNDRTVTFTTTSYVYVAVNC